MFQDAMQRARDLDAYFSRTGRLVGPMHGIPVSVKDQVNVKGIDTTLGYVARAFKPAVCDAPLVTILKSLGAIIITKTAIPQSILVCTYPVWPASDRSLFSLQ